MSETSKLVMPNISAQEIDWQYFYISNIDRVAIFGITGSGLPDCITGLPDI